MFSCKYLLKKLIASLLLIVLAATSTVTFAQQKKKKKQNKPAPAEIAKTPVPYVVEVNEEMVRSGLIITMAVNSITIFRCPERPQNVIPGIEKNGIEQGAPISDRGEVYLRPTVPGIYTDIVFDMPSASFKCWVRTIAVNGGASVGDYTSVVLVKNSKYDDELARSRDELTTNKEEITKLKDQISELEGRLAQKKVGSDQNWISALKLLESTSQTFSKSTFVDSAGGRLRIYQIGRPVKVGDGWIALFSVENRSKEQQILEDVRVENGSTLTTLEGPRKIAPKQEVRLALLFESANKDESNKQLTFVVSGAATNIKVQG